MKFLFEAMTVGVIVVASTMATPLKRQAPLGPVPSIQGKPIPLSSARDGNYPRIAHFSGNTYFAGWAVHVDGRTSIECAFSSDGGNTWQQRTQVLSEDAGGRDLDNPFPIQLQTGRIIMAYRNHERNAAGYVFFHLGTSYSDDMGNSWYPFTDIDARAHTGAPGDANGIWEPLLRVGRDGKLQAYFSSENNAGDQDSWMKVSDDNGQTWQPWRSIGGGRVTARDGMLGIASIDNGGGLIAVFETTECGGRFCVKALYSSDDGNTWGGRSTVYEPPASKNAGAPSVQNIFGTLVVSFMTDETMAGSNGYDGAEAKILTSTDGGHSWGHKLTVASHAHWPALTYEGLDQLSMAVGVDGTGVVRQAIHLDQ